METFASLLFKLDWLPRTAGVGSERPAVFVYFFDSGTWLSVPEPPPLLLFFLVLHFKEYDLQQYVSILFLFQNLEGYQQLDKHTHGHKN